MHGVQGPPRTRAVRELSYVFEDLANSGVAGRIAVIENAGDHNSLGSLQDTRVGSRRGMCPRLPEAGFLVDGFDSRLTLAELRSLQRRSACATFTSRAARPRYTFNG